MVEINKYSNNNVLQTLTNDNGDDVGEGTEKETLSKAKHLPCICTFFFSFPNDKSFSFLYKK